MEKKWFFDPLKPGKYNVILIDPSTRFKGHSPFPSEKGPQYQTMSDAWIRSLPVRHLAAAYCLLWMWATFPKLPDYQSYMDAWGFHYVTGGAWFKRTKNGKIAYTHGHVVQGGAEMFLLGRIGRPIYIDRPIKGVLETDEEYNAEIVSMLDGDNALNGLRRENSRKPDEQYAFIDKLMGTEAPRCELFARQEWPGYEAWGNQADHFTPMEDHS